jgi:16S rRNA (guanine527-N7)-methyltransferase
MKHFPNAEIARELLPYDVELTDTICDQIRSYTELLLRWNRHISLTTVVKPLEILRFHFGESLFAVRSVPIRHGRLADVGSGAGFPAIPLRMASDDIAMVLIESNRKKCAFLAEVVRELMLANVEIYPGRMESLHSHNSGFDYVTARAVAIDDAALKWSSSHLRSGGSAIFWVGHDDSIQIARSNRFHWRDSIKIPNSDRRLILVGTAPDK